MRKKDIKYFTEEERAKFIEVVKEKGNYRDWVMFNLFFLTGLRLSELNNLTIGKVLEGLKTGFLEIKGKGKKTRYIPIVEKVKRIFEDFLRWKEENGESLHTQHHLFLNKKGKKITNRGIQYKVSYFCKKAGIRELSPHSFRHSFGFMLGKKGVSIQVIQKLLGHSNINTTKIYVEPDLEQLKRGLEVLTGA